MDTDIKSEVAVQANEIKHIQDDMSVDNIDKLLSEAKGGWRTLMWAAGAGGAVAAFVLTVQQFFWGK